ncbi:MAG: hypothetical protein NZ898_16335 [Myxococcota bacterium]|nr:hypothetical protein [Myxococcota bacterium]
MVRPLTSPDATRRWRRAATASLVAALLALLPASSRADWLAWWPDCAFGPSPPPGAVRLLYPRAGLGALVRPGEPLAVRVRLPLALTPPPGRQQDRALLGWSVALVPHALYLPGTEGTRLALRVLDVRPESVDGLAYRATVRIPRWAAPGVYALEVSAPGGRARSGAAVRILSHARAPRVVVLLDEVPDDSTERLATRLAAVEADAILLRGPEAAALARALEHEPLDPPRPQAPLFVVVDDAAAAMVLEAESRLLVTGRCTPRHVAFDHVVAALARQRSMPAHVLELLGGRPPLGHAREHGVAVTSAWPQPPSVEIHVAPDGGVQLRAHADGNAPTTWTLLHDGVREALDVGPISARRSIAAGLGTPPVRPVVATHLRLEPGTIVPLRRIVRPPPRIVPAPPCPRPNRRSARLGIRLAETPHLVAWSLDDERTALGPSVASVWRHAGTQRVYAAALTADGRLALAHADVHVRSAHRRSEACSPGLAPTVPPSTWPLTGAALHMLRRSRRTGSARTRSAR